MFYFVCKKGVLCIIWNRLGATWDQNDVLLGVWMWAWGDLWSESPSRFYFFFFTAILGLLHSFIVHGRFFRFFFLFGPEINWSLIRWPDDEDRVDRGWITAAPVSHRFSPNLPRDRWSSDNAWISHACLRLKIKTHKWTPYDWNWRCNIVLSHKYYFEVWLCIQVRESRLEIHTWC